LPPPRRKIISSICRWRSEILDKVRAQQCCALTQASNIEGMQVHESKKGRICAWEQTGGHIVKHLVVTRKSRAESVTYNLQPTATAAALKIGKSFRLSLFCTAH
jgi:hypothetical protein